jgi:flavin reductase (DIM6/NTAB) family NADH-FMN oxidoreductase RutF
MDFKEINIYDLDLKLFDLIDNKWGLIFVGDLKENNIMTASWMSFGILWNYPVVNIYIRPTRYTYNLIEKNDFFSVSFFNDNYNDKLKFCGTKSGRNINKVKECDFNLILKDFFIDRNKSFKFPIIKEAEIIFICQKIYFQDIDKNNFLIPEINKNYNNDYHRCYIGKILTVFKK